MSRLNYALKNLKISVFFYFLFLFVQFFSRKLFLDHLGDEYIGLSSTLRGFLSLLNLAELGIGTAIGYNLYKPIFNKDHKRINELIGLFGYLYKRIGLLILICGTIISFFFPIIFKDLKTSIGIVYFTYYTFLFGMSLNFFFNYHITLLQADQKDYVVTSNSQTLNLTKLILQCVLVYFFDSVVGWISLELLFYISNSYVLRQKVKKIYPWLNIKQKTSKSILKNNKDIIKKVKQVSVHKLGAFVTNGTDKILIFAFISIETVAFFGNYSLLFSRLLQLINTAFAGTAAGIGNLVAENNKENIKKIFWEMMALRFYLGGIAFILLYFITEPFISLWLGEKYILSKWVLNLFLINMFIKQIRVPVDHFKDAYGLFQDVWAPVIQSIINLTMSIILLHYFDLAGILMGTTIAFSIIILIWRPYYLYKYGFQDSLLKYWKDFSVLIISMIIPFYLCTLVSSHISIDEINLINLIFFSFKHLICIIFIYTPCIYLTSAGFRNVSKRIFNLIKTKI